jgi:EmrB/QacA subfamily drug resistance transporter
MTETAKPSQTSADRENAPHAWWILAIVLSVAAMDILDGTVVNVAIPSIRDDLGTSSTSIQWIVGGYALTFAIGLIVGGRLGDIYGRKRMFQIGVTSFTVISLLCGLAPSTEVLVVTRLLQGFAAATMIPQGFGLIRESFSQEDLPKALGFWGPSSALGALLGPVVGGLIIGLNAFGSDWRGVFLVNVPLGIIAVTAGSRLLPTVKAKDTDGLDAGGAALMGTAVGLLFFPLIEGREKGWPLWIFAMFVASFAMFLVFFWFERRRKAQDRSQLILMSIFERISMVAGSFLLTLLFIVIAGQLLVMTLYLQIDQHFSAIHAGLTFVPLSIGTATGAISAGVFLLDRIGRHTLHAGTLIAVIGIVAIVLVLDADGKDITSFDLAVPLLVTGTGIGLLISPSWSFAMSGLRFREIGSASGTLNTMQQLGIAIGVAGIGSIFFSVAGDHGMLVAIERSYVVIAASVVVIAALVFLLPMKRDREPGT